MIVDEMRDSAGKRPDLTDSACFSRILPQSSQQSESGHGAGANISQVGALRHPPADHPGLVGRQSHVSHR